LEIINLLLVAMLKRKLYFKLFVILSLLFWGYDSTNPQISTEWVNRYDNSFFDSGSTVKIDQNNNVYVLGTTLGLNDNFDIVLIKYSSTGFLQWIKYYDGPDTLDDFPGDISLDNGGNIYVTGSSEGVSTGRDGILLKYNSNGSLMWSRRYTSNGNHTDAMGGTTFNSGFLYLTGFSYGGQTIDCIVLKYDINGNELWNKRYTVGTGSTEGYNIIDDKYGNSYVCGRCNGDAFSLKYDPHGNLQWTRFYNGPGNREDVAYWIMLDSAMNVYTAGSSIGQGNNFRDYLILKHSNAGDSLWTIRYNGSGQFDDDIRAMVFDNSGNILVTGQSIETGQGYNFTTIKYSPDGKEIWKSFYNNGLNDFGRAITFDSEDNVFITGYSDGNGTDFDFATVKYDSAGNKIWTTRYNFSGEYDDEAYSIALDNMANVYVTGRSNRDMLTIKYSQPTGMYSQTELLSNNYFLSQNYPNPFNPKTNLSYTINSPGKVILKVFDIKGNEISTLVNEYNNSGHYEMIFDGSNLNSGIYFYSLFVNGVAKDTKKMLLIK